MPKVLLITCAYPPDYQVGAERITKFEKYLPAFGFETCVLTMASQNRAHCNDSGAVYRAFEPGKVYRPLARMLMGWGPSSSIAEKRNLAFLPRRRLFDGTSFASLRNWALDHFAIPDLQVSWFPAALWMGSRAIKKEKVNVILSSSSPETPHLVAAVLSKIAKVPWVADFRDGWLFEPLKLVLRQDHFRRGVEQRLEKIVVSNARAVISVSDPMTEYFGAAYPCLRSKFKTISNGYDAEDWQDVQNTLGPSRKFRIVHTGRVALSRHTLDLHPFITAVQSLEEEVKSNMEVLLIGELMEHERAHFSVATSKDIFKIMGQVNRTESLSYQLAADCLLLFAGKDRCVVTSKLFEYLNARRPILAVSSPDTAAASILKQTEAGEIVNPDDPQAIASHLTCLYRRWQKGDLSCSPRGIERYERKELTRQLAEVLRSVIGQARKSN